MGMGFVLPFALMFVAIPLETFVHSLRTVVGVVGVAMLRALSWLLRLLGNMFRFSGAALVNAYDLLIIVPLWIERLFKGRGSTATVGDGDKDDSVPYRGAA
jgi:hypothetical protein